MINFRQVAALAAFVLLASLPHNANATDNWDVVIAPYILLPFIDGNASIGRIEGAGVDVDPVDVVKALDIGAMLHVEARHKSGFGLALDYGFMDLGQRSDLLGGAGEAKAGIFQGILEAYGTYQVSAGMGTLDLYGGIRWWDLDIDLDITGGPVDLAFDVGNSWVDPVVGLRWTTPFANQKVRFILQGDVGGFSVGSRFSWNIQSGIAWDTSDSFSLIFQYRILSVDRRVGQPGTPDRFVYDTITHGPLIGFAFRL